MNFFNESARLDIILVSISTVIILFAIAITATMQGPTETPPFSKIITVGPVWNSNTWLCTSTSPFMIHGTLIGYQNNNILEIFVSGSGTQPDFILEQQKMETFSVGGIAGSTIRVTSLTGQITGFLTLQTQEGAVASCEQI